MARVHVLRGGDRAFGFTLDEQGTNLPRQYGPWTTFKTIELHLDEPHQGVYVSDCLDDIGKYGFHLTAAHERITHLAVGGAPEKGARALVLGGGGASGNAWSIGVIAGLFEAGVDLTQADLIIGTSAGSTVGAQITSANPTKLLAECISIDPPEQAGPTGADGGPTPMAPAANHMEILRGIIDVAKDAPDMRRKVGAAALAMDAGANGSRQTQWRSMVAARLPSKSWPQRTMRITAVDAHRGEPVVFDRHSGVELVDAVAASCTSGFGVPPYTIGDSRYIDGGYRANENADLAAGYARVLVLSPFGGRSLHPAGWGTHLAAQAAELRARGSRVETIFPDSSSQNALGSGMKVMDRSRRRPSAEAGYAQGGALAALLGEFWADGRG